jgi:hypothetical protein
VYIYTMFIAASFFYYKSVFSQFRLCGSWKIFCKIRWALKFSSTSYKMGHRTYWQNLWFTSSPP